MSITLLLEKYDVSTEEGLQKALNEIEKEELEVDEALRNALGKSCTLEGRLRTASQAYTKLGEMKNDALAAADMVQKTAILAQDVSAKVRQLDLARTRVAECQRRVHDLIDLQLCSSGVEAAIKAHDLEAGAAHVARYLSMAPASLAAARARGASDPRHGMEAAADQLTQLLTAKFEEAARKDDAAGVERVVKLFPQVGRDDAGHALHATYIASKLEATLPSLSTWTGDPAQCIYADAFTRVLEAAAAAQRALQGSLTSQPILQPVVCRYARRVISALIAARQLPAPRPAPAPAPAAPSAGPPAAPASPAAAELALCHRTLHLYMAFVRNTVASSVSSSPDDVRQQVLCSLEQQLSSSDLTRLAQDILGHYLTLEKLHLDDDVQKAVRMFQAQADDDCTLVDDVFFIAKRALLIRNSRQKLDDTSMSVNIPEVITRAISTCSVEAVCVMLNECSDMLQRCAAPPLQPAGWRGVALLPPVTCAQPAQVVIPAGVVNRMRAAELGAEWAEQLASDACAAAPHAQHPHAREKVVSCAGGLAGAAAAFRSAVDAHTALLMAASASNAQAWCEAVLNTDDADIEEDCAAEALPLALAAATAAIAPLPPRTARPLPARLVTDLLARLERAMLTKYYTQKSGLLLERRARRLAAWAGTHAAGARERCARLTQLCALLALDAPAHAPQVAGNALQPAVVKAVLARRTDFKIEDIKRLKL